METTSFSLQIKAGLWPALCVKQVVGFLFHHYYLGIRIQYRIYLLSKFLTAQHIVIKTKKHYAVEMTPPYPNGRKCGGTKEPLDEGERREWKTWLKTQRSQNEDHGTWSHHFMANRWGNNGNSDRLYFWGAPKSLQMVTAAMKSKDTCSLEEKLCPT